MEDSIHSHIHSLCGGSKHEVTACDSTTPAADVISFLGPYLKFCIDETEIDPSDSDKLATADVFTVLMSTSTKASHLPAKYPTVSINILKLHNDVIDWLKD